MAGAIRKVGNHVKEGLEKIREKHWAEPLGKGLAVGAQIVSGMENFVPGIGILGEPSIADLQKELQEIKTGMVDAAQSKAIVRALQRQQKELEHQIENPAGEIQLC